MIFGDFQCTVEGPVVKELIAYLYDLYLVNIFSVFGIGGGVVTTRAHVHYIVTEYGVVNLFGKNLRQRAHALISIAHPSHREDLEREAVGRLKCMPSA